MNRCPEKVRREVFIKYICGYTPRELADEFGIHFTTIYRWIERWKKSLSKHTLAELPLQDMGTIFEYADKLKRQLDEVECFLAIIHESGVIQMIPKKKRVNIAKKYAEVYPVKLLCDTFEVPLSTLYYYRRKIKSKTQRQREECDISNAIRAIFEESKGRLGAERIRVLLHKQGITTSKRRISKLMKQMGLYSNRKTTTYYSPDVTSDLKESIDVKIL